jgi:hypothetical protein
MLQERTAQKPLFSLESHSCSSASSQGYTHQLITLFQPTKFTLRVCAFWVHTNCPGRKVDCTVLSFRLLAMSDNLAIIMVGLPATGKSFTSRNLSRYLRWLGFDTFTFSAAKYRQDMLQGHKIKAEFFDSSNQDFLHKRTQVADATLKDMINWFKRPGVATSVAIMDASNTIHERRRIIKGALDEIGVKTIFVECVYETEGLLNEHLSFLHLLSPDYESLQSSEAQEDYMQRIKFYRTNYATVNELDGSFIKLINGGQQIILNEVSGFLPSKIIFYLMNLHFGSKKIFLQPFANEMSFDSAVQNCKDLLKENPKLSVWTAPDLLSNNHMKTTVVDYKSQLTALNMANLESLSPSQIAELYPEEVTKQLKNPYKHRFPRCESYADLCRRLETVMMELEKVEGNVLIIADISVIRCIYSYFVETSNPNVSYCYVLYC